MNKRIAFKKGVNLGGWFSQCDYSEERLDGFITEPDFAQIAAWGFDHVRIPIDYNVLLREGGSFLPEGFARIDRALTLCKRYGLGAVLDLHKTPGFSFDSAEGELGFFDNEESQELFYRIWTELAWRYGAEPDRVMFELLNEVTEECYLPQWKRISAECVRRIRAIAPQVRILLGSFRNSGVRELQYLDPLQDENILYVFHCYEPLAFTHQGAYWVPWLDRDARVPYAESGATEEFFENLFTPALEKARVEGTSLYCGEYGVIDLVPPEEALRWFAAIHAVLERHGIGRAVWSYKEMDFGLCDARLDALRPRLLELL